MNKKILALTIFILLITGFWVFTKKQFSLNKQPQEAEVILYYSLTCSHCKIVEEWLEKNPQIEEKANLVTKEVYQNNNGSDLLEKVKRCQLDQNQEIRVPFLYDQGECFVGDQVIINHLQEKYQ